MKTTNEIMDYITALEKRYNEALMYLAGTADIMEGNKKDWHENNMETIINGDGIEK